jgi:hypothetical protein
MCVHNPLKVIDILSTHNMFNFVHVPMHGLFINMLNPTGILRTLSASDTGLQFLLVVIIILQSG